MTWPHCEACAWTAAWLTARGRELVGTRELLLESTWRGELRFKERGETRRRGHRPDLACRLSDGAVLPIEVELTEKSSARLPAVLKLHAEWVAAGQERRGDLCVRRARTICSSESSPTGEQAGLSVERAKRCAFELNPTRSSSKVDRSASARWRATDWHLDRKNGGCVMLHPEAVAVDLAVTLLLGGGWGCWVRGCFAGEPHLSARNLYRGRRWSADPARRWRDRVFRHGPWRSSYCRWWRRGSPARSWARGGGRAILARARSFATTSSHADGSGSPRPSAAIVTANGCTCAHRGELVHERRHGQRRSITCR